MEKKVSLFNYQKIRDEVVTFLMKHYDDDKRALQRELWDYLLTNEVLENPCNEQVTYLNLNPYIDEDEWSVLIRDFMKKKYNKKSFKDKLLVHLYW